MPLTTRNISIPNADGGTIPASVAFPAVVPAPVLVMIAGIYGVNEGARGWGDRFADHGFVVVAPNMFWRRTVSRALDQDVADDVAESRQRGATFDHEAGVRDLSSVRDFVRRMPECNGKWSAAGYCFGGRYALIAGGKLGADAIVAFHPSRMDRELDTTAAVTCPMSFHCGGADPVTPPDLLATMRGLLEHNPQAEIVAYPGAVHAFTGHGRPAYDEHASETSFAAALHTLETLK